MQRNRVSARIRIWLLCLAHGAAKEVDEVRRPYQDHQKMSPCGSARTRLLSSLGIPQQVLLTFVAQVGSEIFALIQILMHGKGVASHCMSDGMK